MGGKLCLWGHGLRERQLRGPQEATGPPQTVQIKLRRYLCRRCQAVVLVMPQGVVPRRYYAAPALALALALFALLRLPAADVRKRVNPWQVVGATAADGWSTLVRWCKALQKGELFGLLRPCPSDFTLRQVAERAAATFVSLAPPGMQSLGPEVRAFLGGGLWQRT